MVSPNPQQVIRLGALSSATVVLSNPELASNFSAGHGDNPHEP
jgi:hypothetical protein